MILASYTDYEDARGALELLEANGVLGDLCSKSASFFNQTHSRPQIEIEVADRQYDKAVEILAHDDILSAGLETNRVSAEELERQALENNNFENVAPRSEQSILEEQANERAARAVSVQEADSAFVAVLMHTTSMLAPVDHLLVRNESGNKNQHDANNGYLISGRNALFIATLVLSLVLLIYRLVL